MKIFLSSHGCLASGMVSSLGILYGSKPDNLYVFDAYVNDELLENKLNEFFESTDEDETKVLVSDLYGGSVCQMMMRYMDRKNTFVLTGVNLGMLLALILKEDVTKEELEEIVESARTFTCIVDEKLLEGLNSSDSEDDFL